MQVRNRTPQEIKDGVPLSQAREKELAYFEKHIQLQKLLPDRAGVDALVARLVDVQFSLIVNNLPKLKKQVRRNLEATRAERAELSKAVVADDDAAWDAANDLLRVLRDYLTDLRRGDYSSLSSDQEDHPLKVPRRVFQMAVAFRDELEAAVPLTWFLGAECQGDIKKGSKDGWGVALANFPMHPVFAKIFKERVHKELSGPAADLITKTRQYMEETLFSMVDKDFKSFGRLASKVKEHIQDLLDEQEAAARRHVELLIRQQAIIQTLNHYYMDTVNRIKEDSIKVKEHRHAYAAQVAVGHGRHTTGADPITELRQKYDSVEQAALNCMIDAISNEDQGAVEMQISLMAYAKVVLKRVYDDVALGVRLLLVEEVGDRLTEKVLKRLRDAAAGDNAMLELMQDKHRADKARRLADMASKPQKVDDTLSRVTL